VPQMATTSTYRRAMRMRGEGAGMATRVLERDLKHKCGC
jgi:hypothetical protein